MDYTTLEALRKFGTFDSSQDDTLLSSLIAGASRVIDRHCGRVFGTEAESTHIFTRRLYPGAGYVDPFDGPTLLLDDDLAEAASAITGSPSVTYLTPNKPPYWAIMLDSGGWTSPVSVTGWWAYSKTPPPDIETACLRLSKWLYELRNTTRGDAVVVTAEGAVLLPARLPADVLVLLAPYVRPRIAR